MRSTAGSGTRTGSPARPSTEPVTKSTRRPDRRIYRFDEIERLVHWLTGAMVLVLIATAGPLYVPAFANDLGGRAVVQPIHIAVGLCMLIPVVLAIALPWGRALRADLRRINGFTRADRDWFRVSGGPVDAAGRRVEPAALGKFNPGQKLNTVLVGASLVVLLISGSVMTWPRHFPVGWDTGATFVHDCAAIGLTILVTGHIVMALFHPQAMRSIVTGWISESWAAKHAPAWLTERREVESPVPATAREPAE